MGMGLAYRWALAGRTLVIGSRIGARAEEFASALLERVPDADVVGKENVAAAAMADIVVLTVPYVHHQSTLETIREASQGKIFVDATVPLRPPKVGRVQLPEAGCAALEAQRLLGEGVDVVAAFQNVGAHNLNSDGSIDCDILISGDKVAARGVVLELVQAAGMRGWHVGPLANSAAAEALTSVLIQINKNYKYAGAGIRITPGGSAGSTDSYAPDRVEMFALKGIPLVEPGQDLAQLIATALSEISDRRASIPGPVDQRQVCRKIPSPGLRRRGGAAVAGPVAHPRLRTERSARGGRRTGRILYLPLVDFQGGPVRTADEFCGAHRTVLKSAKTTEYVL